MNAHPNHSGAPVARARRPRWLLPVLVVAVLGIALVWSGVLSASAALYAFAFGGMLLMHAGGHGGHGGHGSGQAADAPEAGEVLPAEAADEGRKGGGCH